MVSKEEETYLKGEQPRQESILLRQLSFPGIEDHLLSFAQFEPSDDRYCPFTIFFVYNALEKGLWRQLPEICYHAYTSYIHYPQGTGSSEVDQMLAAWAEARRGKKDAGLITYVIGRPSPRYISIAFCEQIFWFGYRVYRYWTAYNYDLEHGRALELADIFPDMERSKPLLEDYILRGQFWPHWGENPEYDEEFYPLDMSASRLFLKSDGVYVVYNIYEQGPFGDGTKVAFIPVADMPKLGGNTVFWEK